MLADIFPAFWIFHSTDSWPPSFLLRSQLLILLRLPCLWHVLLSRYFKGSLSVFDFRHLTMMCLSEKFFKFIYLELVDFFECVHCFFINLGSLSMLFLQIFLLPISLLSWNFYHAYVYMLYGVPQVSDVLSTLLILFSSFLRSDNINWPIFKFAESFFFQTKCYSAPSVNFYFIYIYIYT